MRQGVTTSNSRYEKFTTKLIATATNRNDTPNDLRHNFIAAYSFFSSYHDAYIR